MLFRLAIGLAILSALPAAAQVSSGSYCGSSQQDVAESLTGEWTMIMGAGTSNVHAPFAPMQAIGSAGAERVAISALEDGVIRFAAFGEFMDLYPEAAAQVLDDGYLDALDEPIDMARVQQDACDFAQMPTFSGYRQYDFGVGVMYMVITLTFADVGTAFGTVAFYGTTTQARLAEVIGDRNAEFIALRPLSLLRGP